MSYQHLSLAERHYIEIENKAGTSLNMIAQDLGGCLRTKGVTH